MARGHRVWLQNRLVVGSIPTRGNKLFIYIYILISSLSCQGKARRWVQPLSTQCLQNSAESGERNVLTLGSLCLPCYVRDTMWSWFFLIYSLIYVKTHFILLIISAKIIRSTILKYFPHSKLFMQLSPRHRRRKTRTLIKKSLVTVRFVYSRRHNVTVTYP